MGILGSIGSAFKAVTNVVNDVAGAITGGVADVAKGVVGAATSLISDTFEIADGLTGGILGKLSDFMGGSLGTMLNKGLDALGLPDWVGDIAGATLDFCTGNFIGAAANGLDALEDLAKACGGDELAAFLKTGSEITNMFSPAGAMNLGKAGEIANAASAIIDKIEGGMGVLTKLQTGDILGAGADLFNLAGIDAGELVQTISETVDSDLSQMVISCFGHAETAMNFLDDPAKGMEDLLKSPLSPFGPAVGQMFNTLNDIFDNMKQAGIDVLPPDAHKIIGPGVEQIGTHLCGAFTNMASGGSFSGSVLQSGRDMIMQGLQEAFQQVIMCNDNSQGFNDIADLLRQAAARLETVDLQCHHGTAIRA